MIRRLIRNFITSCALLSVALLSTAFANDEILPGAALQSAGSPTAALPTVLLVSGGAFEKTGEIIFQQPKVGEAIPVNPFGQYIGQKHRDGFQHTVSRSYVKWHTKDDTEKPVQQNQIIEDRKILRTSNDGFLKLFFSETLTLDIGPKSLLQIEFDQIPKLKLLYGSFRIINNQRSESDLMLIDTTNAKIHFRGSEILIFVEYPDNITQNDFSKTDITCIHGRSIVDTYRYNQKGLVYLHPYVLNPANFSSVSGRTGLAENLKFYAISQDALKKKLAEFGPLVDVYSTTAAQHLRKTALPGTESPLEERQPFTEASALPLVDMNAWTSFPPQRLNPIFLQGSP